MDYLYIPIVGVIVFTLLYLYNERKKNPSQKPTDGISKPIQPDIIQKKTATNLRQNSIRQIFGNESNDTVLFDKFTSIDKVTSGVRRAGLESCNLIFGVDYTYSNLMAQQSKRTFGGKSLHKISPNEMNPYQQVIRILGETLEPFDDDGIIPAFGFGDMTTKDRSVFPFKSEGYCTGFHDVLDAYNKITPSMQMSGPTSFAPLIRQAIDIVKGTKSYHILVIVADGQVNSERETIDAIVEASGWPMSIIMVGVGDGPWDTAEEFVDKIPARKFDNFQFVEFYKVTSTAKNPQAAFALQTLMDIPDQYKNIKNLGLLNLG